MESGVIRHLWTAGRGEDPAKVPGHGSRKARRGDRLGISERGTEATTDRRSPFLLSSVSPHVLLRNSCDCIDHEDPRRGLGKGDCTCIRYPVLEYGEGVIYRFRSETGNHAGQKRFASFPALTTDRLLSFLVSRYHSTGFPRSQD